MAKNPGNKFEEWIVSSLEQYFQDARRTKASGSVWKSGDVQAGPYEIEAKDRPSQKSVSISQAVLERTEDAAKSSGRIPLVANRNEIGTYVTVRWNDFVDMVSRLIYLETEVDDLGNIIEEMYVNFKNK